MISNSKTGDIELKIEETRDLKAARDAYENKDIEASRIAHTVEKKKDVDAAEEGHNKTGEFIKSIVLGGLDGIMTTFAVVSGARGGNLSTSTILIMGFSNIIADALSMGVGDALSTKAENEYVLNEKSREEWELENFPEGEIKEMVDLYVEKGMKQEDAENIIQTYSKYPKLFVDLMMAIELELQVPGEDDNPWKDGFVTFTSFLFFGAFPLLSYAVLKDIESLSEDDLFIISCCITAVMLFILGTLKTRFSIQKWWVGGSEILIMGSITACVAYFVGMLVESIVKEH